jgi:4'-phosphopantetheinyl transferase
VFPAICRPNVVVGRLCHNRGMPDPLPCHVWWARRTEVDARHEALLSPVERARRDQYVRPEDRDRFTVAAGTLRLVAAELLGVAPGALTVDRTCERCGKPHGRPTLPGHDLHVSLSHSGDWVAVATTRLGPVGVDVERIGPADYRKLLRHVADDAEQPEIRTTGDFYRCWTRKEAVLKATGDGLRTPMPGVRLRTEGGRPVLVSYAGRPGLVAQLADLGPRAGYHAAVAVLTGAPLTVEEHAAATRSRAG